MQRPELQADLPSMRCVGYRQGWQVLFQAANGRPAHGAALPLLSDAQRQRLLEAGVAATRQLAKRQITWLRSMPNRVVVAADAADATAQVIQAANTWRP